MALAKDYMAALRERGKKSRIYRKYQLVGLALAEALGDEKHKALYIKLARDHDHDKILAIAGGIKNNLNVKNKGAYFMRIVFPKKKTKKKKTA